MNKKLISGLLACFLIIFLMAALSASGAYTIPSHAELDTSFQGNIPPNFNIGAITTQEGAGRFPFTWWRNTDNQNSLWEHSYTEYTNSIKPVYVGADYRVLVYNGQIGTNVVAVIGPTGNTIIGCGGSRNTAKIALSAFSKVVPDFQVELRGIILTDANQDTYWGTAEFIGSGIERTAPVFIYAHSSFLEVGAIKQAVSTAVVQHNLYAYGPEIPYGPNGNLGVGSEFSFNPYQPNNGMIIPNRFISSETTINPGGVSMTLTPGAGEDAGLMVFLPTQKILVVGEIFGKYFPPIGGLTGFDIPATRWINKLNYMKTLNANYLVSLHSLPITNSTDVSAALTDQKNALMYVHTQTVSLINAGYSLDDIVASVRLPDSLNSSPWVQEYTSTVANAVKAIYHQYMGWFDWEVDSLNTLTQLEQSMFIVHLAGGPEKALAVARKYMQDNTTTSIQQAVIICKSLHYANPSKEADMVYIQALRKLGYAQTSGQVRNYYLLMAQKLENAL